MKTKNFLIGILSVFSFSMYAQTEHSNVNNKTDEITKLTTTELNFESNNLEDFSTIYWNMTKELLKRNGPNQEIVLSIAYINDADKNKDKTLIDGFKAEFKGTTSELIDLMTSDLKNSLVSLSNINGLRKN